MELDPGEKLSAQSRDVVDPMATRASLLFKVRDPKDEQAWIKFVDRYGPQITMWCRKWFPRESEDMVQEVLLALVTKLRTLEYSPNKGYFRGWLRTTTQNLMIDLARKRKRGVRHHGGHFGESDMSQEEARIDLEEKLAAEYDLELLETAKERVRSRVETSTWSAYVMTAEDQRTPAKVAAELGMRVGAVYQAKSNIIKLLREELRKLTS